MSLLAVEGAVLTRGALAGANPTAKLVAATVLGVGLLAAVDPVTAAVALTLELGALRALGIPLGRLLLRSWPLVVTASGVALTNVLLGEGDPLQSALGTGLRVLAVALPGVAVVLTVDPTDLADSLVQQARVPARFAYGALAALRLLPLLGAEWRSIARARRARGVAAGRSPVRAVALFAGQVFALLVGALRRGTRLAVAMDARGFDADGVRTIARPQVVRAGDRWLVAGAAALVATAVCASVALGTFRGVWTAVLG